MQNLNLNLVAAAAATLLGMSAASGSTLLPNASGGSEAVLSLVNGSNATITQDLGKQIGQISNGDSVPLSAAVQSFISTAGGLANVSFAIIGGDSTTRNYLSTTTNADLGAVEIANSERNVWVNTLNILLGTLNSGDATASGVNNTYGPLPTGTDGNYLDGGFDLWNGSYVQNTGPANDSLLLYRVIFGTNNLQNAQICPFFVTPSAACSDLNNPLNPLDSNSFARLDLSTNKVQFGTSTVVPAPGAIWLLGTGLAGLVGRRWRRARTT